MINSFLYFRRFAENGEKIQQSFETDNICHLNMTLAKTNKIKLLIIFTTTILLLHKLIIFGLIHRIKLAIVNRLK